MLYLKILQLQLHFTMKFFSWWTYGLSLLAERQQHKQYHTPENIFQGDMLSQHNWKFDFSHLKMCYHELCLISRSIYCLHLKDFKMLSMCLDVSQIRWLAAYLNKTSLQNLVCLFYA